jgi:hypothetical protein
MRRVDIDLVKRYHKMVTIYYKGIAAALPKISDELLHENLKKYESHYTNGQGYYEDVMQVIELYWAEQTRRAIRAREDAKSSS